jgi:hypothetical protein
MNLNRSMNYVLALLVMAASSSACLQEELPGDEAGIELEAVGSPEQPDELGSLGHDPEMEPTEAESGDQSLRMVEDGDYGQASPGYPYYQYEGLYPTQTPCSGSYYLPPVSGGAIKTAIFQGRTITLKYYYNGGCGSFARIDNAPSGQCWAFLDRSNDGGWTWDNVAEPVDPGITYAYTKVGNNLNGRVSRAALVCGNLVLARTNWY